MSFYAPENLRAVMGGRWLQRVPQRVILDGVGIDSREDLSSRIFFAIKGPHHDGHDFLAQAVERGAGLLVVERAPQDPPPTDAGMLLVPDTRRVLGRLARAYRQALPQTKVIAITGSAGKTTTKALVHAVLGAALRGSAAPRSYNNDIGVPLTLLGARSTDAYVAVEIGTNAPGEVAHLAEIAEPDVAVITLAGHSHLAGLGTVEDVAREKLAILGALREGGLAIVNADVPLLRPAVRRVRNAILYGTADDAHLRLTGRGDREGRWWFEVNGRQRFEIGLPGHHNAMNGLAAVAVARRLGVADDVVSAALAAVTALPMRFDRTDGDYRIYNDAYNANPESMCAALQTFTELESAAARRVLILGEMRELGPQGPELHRGLARQIIELDHRVPIDHVVLVGVLTGRTAEELRTSWDRRRVTRHIRLTPSVRKALQKVVRPGDAVLVKGSRAVGLEQVVEWLCEERSDECSTPSSRTRTSRTGSSTSGSTRSSRFSTSSSSAPSPRSC